jgi:predicted deacetylase
MPYADPSEQAEFNRTLYLQRYQTDQEFREAEAFRKAQWYYRNQAKIVTRYRQKRKKIRAASKVVRSGQPVHCVELPLFAGLQGVPALF